MIRIVTDSTCDLSAQVAGDLSITVVPIYIHVGTEEYLDGVDMSKGTFYQQLPIFETHPTTAAPSTEDFRQAYDELAEDGATEILSIHISSELSATADFARVAAKETESVPVTVFDSGQLSQALGWMAEKAATLATRGESMGDIISQLEEQGSRSHVFTAVDTLTYIRRSGRMHSFVAGIGSLLHIKPILKMHNGVPTSERVRTLDRAYDRLLELLEAASPVESVAILHSSSLERAQHLQQKAMHILPDGETPYVEITPVLGVHLGPGVVGFACISKK